MHTHVPTPYPRCVLQEMHGPRLTPPPSPRSNATPLPSVVTLHDSRYAIGPPPPATPPWVPKDYKHVMHPSKAVSMDLWIKTHLESTMTGIHHDRTVETDEMGGDLTMLPPADNSVAPRTSPDDDDDGRRLPRTVIDPLSLLGPCLERASHTHTPHVGCSRVLLAWLPFTRVPVVRSHRRRSAPGSL